MYCNKFEIGILKIQQVGKYREQERTDPSIEQSGAEFEIHPKKRKKYSQKIGLRLHQNPQPP